MEILWKPSNRFITAHRVQAYKSLQLDHVRMAVDFGAIKELSLDDAFLLTAAFKADNNPCKVSLGAGVYKMKKHVHRFFQVYER